ncbi:MAG: transcription regulator [Amycolatopsis sp.]|uniref:LCP family protein n=1 Tax=Amycolatopsis sp. TaxID=37632 RepID=UPI00261B53B5|nr:LCP family protein [Amycolatopsis sp.]MCU1680543.1 transcription regulator [Amycolatopsis sp.]
MSAPANAPTARRRSGRRRGRTIGAVLVSAVSLVVFGATGYAWTQYTSLIAGLHTSNVLGGGTAPASVHGDTNILIMGLDSRLDENGNPLPQNIYDALHAGDSQDGGYNANVLMLLHVPGDGSKATSISIPRDDYVDLPGCPDQQCKGKIKQAYGLALDAKSKQLAAQGGTDKTQREQQTRDAGRSAEIATVRQFLGGVAIDHFTEVTLVAFFQIAQVVQPITVCVSEDTQDSYSGANFHQGQQQVSAEQAVAFVRQRRDYVHPNLNFTDLDRERRQQAFIASLAFQLKNGGVFTSPAKLQGILAVAKQNIAIDSGLDLLSFAQQASNLTGGNISFVTLPIDHFGKDPNGQDVNFVNLAQVRATVQQLLGTTPAAPTPAPAAGPAAPAAATGTVDVINATSRTGLAGQTQQLAVAHGFTAGTTSTDSKHLSRSKIYYGTGGSAGATALSGLLGGITTAHDTALAAGHVRIVIGADFVLPAAGSSTPPPNPAAAPAPAPAPAPAAGASDNPNALSSLSGGGIPCVK